MKTDMEMIEEYIDHHKERDFVNSLSIGERVLYKCQIRDSLSFAFFKLHTAVAQFFRALKGGKK